MEVIGPIAFCFGSLGFVLSTVPTVAKAGEAFQHCAQRFLTYRRRRTKCEAKFKRWKIKWRASTNVDLGANQSTIDDTIATIEQLKDRIHRTVDRNCQEEVEQNVWHIVKSKLVRNRGVLCKLTTNVEGLHRSVGYVLFTKDLIEDWLNTLEKAVEDLEQLSEMELQNQTADHFGTSLDQDQVEKIGRLRSFIGTLKSSVDSLYSECARAPSTVDWALALRPPENLKDLDNWDRIGHIDIELHLLQQFGGSTDTRNLLLHARYQKEDPATHEFENQIESALNDMIGTRTRTYNQSNIQCCFQSTEVYQLDAIGRLLETQPDYFETDNWKTSRVDLVYGLVNWVLLLWDTQWFEKLCCFGLHIEQGSTDNSLMHTFNSKKCNSATHRRDAEDHHSRLRNLGIALAEIVLGKSIWLEDDSTTPPQYSEWDGGQWRRTYRSEIVEEVLLKSTSIPLCDAIKFCLEDNSPIASEPFEPGYLLRCIEKIHGPVKEWYKVESPNRAAPAIRGQDRQPRATQGERDTQMDLDPGGAVPLTVQMRTAERGAESHPQLRREERRFPNT